MRTSPLKFPPSALHPPSPPPRQGSFIPPFTPPLPPSPQGPFTPEEDNTILVAHEIYGNKWATISKLLPGR